MRIAGRLTIMVRFSLLSLVYGMLSAQVVTAQGITTDPEFTNLQQQLTELNFKVLITPPPQRGAYGLLNASSRTIWIHPLTFELGIASPVLVHEAVHAAQTCKGNGQLESLELEIEPLMPDLSGCVMVIFTVRIWNGKRLPSRLNPTVLS